MGLYTIIKNILQTKLAHIMLDEEFIKLINASAAIVNKPVDFTHRLYYNKETGEPIAYSMEELEGDYITVTKEQYHQGRYDVIVKDNGIFKLDSIQYIRKLIPDQKGVACDPTNVLILDPTSNKKWNVKTHIAE
jgi:hypothetical protein